MANKDKCRKVLQFNLYVFRHKQVLDILNQHPRSMTEMVVNAILHYVSCPDVGLEFSKESIKNTVREVLLEMQAEGTLTLTPGTPAAPEEPAMNPADMQELGGVMNLFRNQG